MPMGMTYLYYALSGVVCRHISVGFLSFLFDLIGIARPPFVNKTTEVCAFFMSVGVVLRHIIQSNQTTGMVGKCLSIKLLFMRVPLAN